MSARINIPPSLRDRTNDLTTVFVEGNTIGECLNDFVKQYPHTDDLLFDKYGKLYEYIQIFLNKMSIHPEGLSKPVKKKNDEIDILYIIMGG